MCVITGSIISAAVVESVLNSSEWNGLLDRVRLSLRFRGNIAILGVMFYGLLTNSIMSDLFQLLNGSLTLLSGQSCNYRVSFRNVVPGRFLLTKHQKSNGPDT